MTTAAAVLGVARSQLGTVESPAGSNNCPYNTWYYGRPVNGGAYPWCAVFVSWVAQEAGAMAIIPKHAYTPAGAAWFQSRGQFSRVPRVGSIVFYHWTGMDRIGHVGIVEAVHSDGSWTAIEGNTDLAGGRTGGRVMRQRRTSVGKLGGFGHPHYEAAPATVAPAPAAPAPAPAAPVAKPPAAPAYPGTLLKIGSKGDAVRVMQERLKLHLTVLGAAQIKADGDFGPATDRAVRDYQNARKGPPYNLGNPDGIVGPATWGSLWK